MSKLIAELCKPRAQLLAFLLFLIAALLPATSHHSHYHGDESYYTDAAIRMVQTGDYWTPYFADGRARFVKPIATYWIIAGSYRLFGINLVSSRWLFVITGGLVVFFTFQLSLALFNRHGSALLAALIAGSNFQLLTLSIRSTPDILLILFVLLSCLGFVQIVFREDRSLFAYLLAYGGAGLAVETKGLIGLFPVGFAFLFCALRRKEGMTIKTLVDWRAMTIGAVIGVFWYAVAVFQNGSVVFAQFFNDQVIAKVSDNPLYCLENLLSYIDAVFRFFFPWTLLVIVGVIVNRQAIASFLRVHRRECEFAIGAFLLIALLFSFSNMRRVRYTAIVYPLLAVLFAAVLTHCLEAERFSRGLGRALKWIAGIVLISAVLFGGAALKIAGVFWIGATLLAIMAVCLFAAARHQTASIGTAAIAGLCIVIFILTENVVRPFFSISPVPTLTANLLATNLPNRTVQAWNLPPSYLGQIRVESGGRLNAINVGKGALPELPPLTAPLVVTEPQRRSVSWTNWTFEPIASASGKWSVKTVRELVFGQNPAATFSTNQVIYYLAQRRLEE